MPDEVLWPASGSTGWSSPRPGSARPNDIGVTIGDLATATVGERFRVVYVPELRRFSRTITLAAGTVERLGP